MGAFLVSACISHRSRGVSVKLTQRKGRERVRNKQSRQKEENSGNSGSGPLTVQSKGLLFPPLSGAIHVELDRSSAKYYPLYSVFLLFLF